MIKIDLKNGLEELKEETLKEYEKKEKTIKRKRKQLIVVILIAVIACVVNYMINTDKVGVWLYEMGQWAHDFLGMVSCITICSCIIWSVHLNSLEQGYAACKEVYPKKGWARLAVELRLCDRNIIEAEKIKDLDEKEIVKATLDTIIGSLYILTKETTFVIHDVQICSNIPVTNNMFLRVIKNKIILQDEECAKSI